MVSYIPRLSSLAVSGTPAKAQMSDLIHVLKYVVVHSLPVRCSLICLRFLRIDRFVGSLRLWNRLLKPGFAREFCAFIQHYGIRYDTPSANIRTLLIVFRRTAKASLTSELTIPKQTRYLVGIELGKVERHVSLIT